MDQFKFNWLGYSDLSVSCTAQSFNFSFYKFMAPSFETELFSKWVILGILHFKLLALKWTLKWASWGINSIVRLKYLLISLTTNTVSKHANFKCNKSVMFRNFLMTEHTHLSKLLMEFHRFFLLWKSWIPGFRLSSFLVYMCIQATS